MTREFDFTARMVASVPYELIVHMWGRRAAELFAAKFEEEGKHTDEGPLAVSFQFLGEMSYSEVVRGRVNKGGEQFFSLNDNGELWCDNVTHGNGDNGAVVRVQFFELKQNVFVHHVPGYEVPGESQFQAVVLV